MKRPTILRIKKTYNIRYIQTRERIVALQVPLQGALTRAAGLLRQMYPVSRLLHHHLPFFISRLSSFPFTRTDPGPSKTTIRIGSVLFIHATNKILPFLRRYRLQNLIYLKHKSICVDNAPAPITELIFKVDT